MKNERSWFLTLRLVLASLLILTVFVLPSPLEAGLNSWSKLDLDGVRINTIAVDPTNSSIIFVGTNGGGVFRSTNGGQSWAPVNNGLGHLFVNDLVFDPGNPSVILAGAGRSPALGEVTAGVYRSTNRGDSWTQQVSAFVDAIAFDPGNPATVFAAGAPVVLKSTNRGVTWAPSSVPGSPIVNVDGTGVTVSPQNSNIVLLVGNTEGGVGQIFRSTDGGLTWNLVLGGLPPLFDVTFAPPTTAGAPLFVAADTGVFRSTDGGLTFSRVSEELGDVSVFNVLVNPLSPGTIFGAALELGVIRSADGGANWAFLDGSLRDLNVRGLAIDQASPQTLYAGTEDGPWAFTFAPSPPPPPPPPPPAPVSFFFAEGSSQPPFDTWFLLQNPTGQAATATISYLLVGGGVITQVVPVPPTSRVSVFANQVLPNQAFSTRIDSNQQIFAERAMYVSFDGHSVTGLRSTSTTWLFAEGSTQPPFHTWLLLENPNSSTASATVTYLLESGQTIVQPLGLPPLSRTSIFVNDILENVAFSSRVDSNLPIVAERAMYRFPGNAATGVVGVPRAASTWYFAEGRTSLRGMPADTFLLLQNPNANTVAATVTLFRSDGTTLAFGRVLPATSRTTLHLNQVVSGEFGISVETSGGDIVAERAIFFGAEPKGAYATQGVTELGTVWNLPEGSTAAPFDEIVSVLNPRSTNLSIRAEFQLQTGQVIVREFNVGPNRKFDILVDDIIANAAVSTRIIAGAPTVVERTMLINKSNLGAHNTVGFMEQ